MMTPTPIASHLDIAFTPKAGALQVRAVLDTRSAVDTGNNSGNGGLQKGTAVLIVAGVGLSCSFVIRFCWPLCSSVSPRCCRRRLRSRCYPALFLCYKTRGV
ncbi:hypothetical protein BDN67DRAFT_376158 [Paxillus ammoniavirescens]|nr:hypothetical protein BDN67DRAFT_376158 [Paxillus ammoniavirescens]